jgi:SAM-dependent methyltransferase
MSELVDALKARGAATLLDLGCGNGRHLVYFAGKGFAVSGLDSSPEGLRLARAWLESKRLVADLRFGSMTDLLPFDSASFDAVVAVQIIHHARVAQIRSLVAEIDRVLRPGGLVFVTVPMLRNQAKSFEEIEAGTFVPLDVLDLKVDAVQHFCLLAEKR